jgi:hypothetical protein
MIEQVRQLRTISMEAFDQWHPPLKVIVHDNARRFAALLMTGANQEIALSWRSDSIEPVLRQGNHSEIWLAVDQRVACLKGDGQILLSLGLASSILDVQCFRDCVAVVCESEVLLFNNDFSILTIQGCSDLPCEVIENREGLFITFDGGRKERIRLSRPEPG